MLENLRTRGRLSILGRVTSGRIRQMPSCQQLRCDGLLAPSKTWAGDTPAMTNIL